MTRKAGARRGSGGPTPAEAAVVPHNPPAPPAKPPLFTAEDSCAEAGRRILLIHFERFLKHVEGTRLGTDIEELHDMRVATRRMRAAFRVFGPAIGNKRLKPYLGELRWIAAELGKVRDLDVFLDYLGMYQRAALAADSSGIQALIDDRRQDWNGARESLLSAMNGERFQSFKDRFRTFLEDELPPVATRRKQETVRKAAPQALRRRFEAALEFAPVLKRKPTPENHHALRIVTKRFRYTVEFFREVYSDSLDPVIEQCVGIQDALGEMHDVDVHREYLDHFLTTVQARTKAAAQQRQSIHNLIAAEAERRLQQQEVFESVWRLWTPQEERKRIRTLFKIAKTA